MASDDGENVLGLTEGAEHANLPIEELATVCKVDSHAFNLAVRVDDVVQVAVVRGGGDETADGNGLGGSDREEAEAGRGGQLQWILIRLLGGETAKHGLAMQEGSVAEIVVFMAVGER